MKAGEIGASMFVLQTGSLSVRQAPAFSPLIKPRASPAPLSPSPLSLEPPREEEEEREKREEEEEEEDLRKTLTPRTKKATFTAAELAEIKLHLRKTEGREREREIMRKGPGSVVGEMSLLSGARRFFFFFFSFFLFFFFFFFFFFSFFLFGLVGGERGERERERRRRGRREEGGGRKKGREKKL